MEATVIPRNLLTNTVTIQPWEGSGGRGDIYGQPVTRPALVQGETQLVRNTRGDEVVSSTQVYLDPIPVDNGSLVTAWVDSDIEITAKVVAVKHYRVRRRSHTVLYLT